MVHLLFATMSNRIKQFRFTKDGQCRSLFSTTVAPEAAIVTCTCRTGTSWVQELFTGTKCIKYKLFYRHI